MKYFKKTKDIVYIKNAKYKINIVQISDLHYSNLIKEKDLKNLIIKIQELKPDYITITGDTIDNTESINNKEKIEIILNFLKSLSSISKVILSLGNHDFYKKQGKKTIFSYPHEFWNQVKKIPNLYLLNNEIYQDEKIEIFGYTQPKSYYWSKQKEEKNIKTMIKDLDNKKEYLKETTLPKIGLIHSPSCITNNKIIERLQNFDLLMSGHMHNGCILPIIDELWKSDRGLISASKKILPHNCRGRLMKQFNNKTINIIISGAITTFSKNSPKILHPFDKLFPYHINEIIITNNQNELVKRTYKYYK